MTMYYVKSLFCALALVAVSHSLAGAHGFSVQLIDNRLVASPGSHTIDGNQQLFVEALVGAPPYTYFSAGDGGVGGMTAGNGFAIPGSSLEIKLTSPLWFSDGSGAGAAPAPLDVQLEVFKEFGNPLATIDGTPGAEFAIPVSGNNTHELTWSLVLRPGASLTSIPAGVYGWSYTIYGSGPGGDFEPSSQLVLALATNNFSLPGGIAEEYRKVFAAATAVAVPEPSSLGLLCAGVGVLLVVRRRGAGRRGWTPRGRRCGGSHARRDR